ncbi:MOB kinase activator 3C isoform X1 [Rhineura floridana]|uniref:MOB kinase activator 3C isoform X1 n=2 Tax=Rhineura floridana TaxID=261503 RepID=UPI002AC83A0D|nr:MOB kinase activator 3C isoform X1 [Rhineura floridana]
MKTSARASCVECFIPQLFDKPLAVLERLEEDFSLAFDAEVTTLIWISCTVEGIILNFSALFVCFWPLERQQPCHHPGWFQPRMALCLKQVFNKDKTFRPRKKFEPGTQRFELYKKAQASLKSGLDLKAVVQLPPGENINDWIAVHLVDFFNRINLIYGTMSEFCTEKSCPIMSGGLKYEYRWQDDYRYKRPTKLSAPQYMCMLMDWIETLINNEDIFPTRIGVPFPKNFQQVCTKILTRLFRVFVHVYIHHFDSIISMGAEAHVNTCYKHFYYFISEFSLVDQRELEPLKEMTERICH